MTRYANIDQLIADYLPEAKSDREKAAVGRILDSASAFVDSYCKRTPGYFAGVAIQPSGEGQFVTYPAGTMKRIRGEGKNFLRLPRHVIGQPVVVGFGASLIDSSYYYESSINGWLYLEGESFSAERSFDHFTDQWIWLADRIYKVTAVWGYAETPLPVVEAVRLITTRIYETQKGTIGQTTSEGFVHERLIPQAAKDLLKQFIRREFEI